MPEAVEKAKEKRQVTQPLVIHSDRGAQYTCRDYEKVTGGMGRSYSAKACPWDNACIESFHALIKREWPNRFRIPDYSHAYRLVFEIWRRSTIQSGSTAIVGTALPANMKGSIWTGWRGK